MDMIPQDQIVQLPFGDQFWALSSIIQCTAIQPNFAKFTCIQLHILSIIKH